MYKYRIDKKYKTGKHHYIKDVIIDFFSSVKTYDIFPDEDVTLPLKKADFVIYNDKSELIELAEIKTQDETQNCSSWISWHSPHTAAGDDFIKRFSKQFYVFDKTTQCFIVAIGIQTIDYLKAVCISHAWFIQENTVYKSHIEKACEFLQNERYIKTFNLHLFKDMVFLNFTI